MHGLKGAEAAHLPRPGDECRHNCSRSRGVGLCQHQCRGALAPRCRSSVNTVAPRRKLFNFTRIFLQVGASAQLEFTLGRAVLALSDDAGDQAVRPGHYTVAIGGVGRAGRAEDGAVTAPLELHGGAQTLFSMGELRARHNSE